MSYSEIKLSSKDGGSLGNLKCKDGGMVWESAGRDRKVDVKKEDVDPEGVEWCQMGSKYQLRLQMSNGNAVRFDGFEAGHYRDMKDYCDKTLGAKLSKITVDIEGRNAGNLDVRGDEMVFRGEKGKKMLDICLPDVKTTQCNPEKCDLVLTFEQGEGLSKKHEGLVEMRFFVPDTQIADEEDAEDAEHETSVAKLHRTVLQYVGKEEDGEKILFLEGVTCRQPRSTFDLTFFTNRFKMHSNTYDFDVPYKSVKRLFKVPSGMGSKPGHYLTLLLDPPLRKGQTHYAYIVLFFESDYDSEPEEIKLNLPDDFETVYKNHPPKLLEVIKPKMKGLMVDMVGDVIRFFATTNDNVCKVLVAKKFQSSDNKEPGTGTLLPAIKCSIGANVGQLYLMDNAFLFLEKPPMAFMYEDVAKITFDRNQSQQKGIKSSSFDFKIKMANGKSQDFNQIPKKELKNLESWFQSQSAQKFDNKKMVITNYKEDDDDSDEPGRADDDDHHANRLKAQADDSDDDSEEDGDFQGGAASDSSSDDGSDDDDEDGSGGGSGSDEDKPKKKKDKKEKKSKKEKKAKKEVKEVKKKKAKKDPAEPKRSKSSYMLFCDEQRPKIKAEQPELSMTDTAKVLGQKWKELSAEDKKPFEDEAKKLSETYKEVKAKYDEENPQEKKRKGKKGDDDSDDDGGGKKKKAKKDPNAPKSKLSAYMIWSAEVGREQIKKDKPDVKPTEIMKELGVLWREMSAEDKKPWEEKASADKARFDEQTKEYKASGGGGGASSPAAKKSKKKKDKMSVDDFEKAADDDSSSASGSGSDAADVSAEDSD